jgi:lysophospholipase L1-like esterase
MIPNLRWATFLALGLVAFAMSSPHGGTRTTLASNSPSFDYTALGDSITVGAYVGMYANHLGTELGVPVNLTNLGLPGYTSGGLAYRLGVDPTFRDSVQHAHLVTVMIGINDYALAGGLYLGGSCGGTDNQDCIRAAENTFRDNFTAIISQIKSLASPNTVVLTSDVYNPSISADLASGNSAVFFPLINQINAYIHSISAANGLGVADVYSAFNGATGLESPIDKGYIAPDGVHPSDLGHQVIADQFGNLDSILLSADSDGDGFSYDLEQHLGTDVLSSCPQNGSDPAFPPDFNNDGRVSLRDLWTVFRAFGKDSTSAGWASTYRRFDLRPDGRITLLDFMTEIQSYGRSGC